MFYLHPLHSQLVLSHPLQSFAGIYSRFADIDAYYAEHFVDSNGSATVNLRMKSNRIACIEFSYSGQPFSSEQQCLELNWLISLLSHSLFALQLWMFCPWTLYFVCHKWQCSSSLSVESVLCMLVHKLIVIEYPDHTCRTFVFDTWSVTMTIVPVIVHLWRVYNLLSACNDLPGNSFRSLCQIVPSHEMFESALRFPIDSQMLYLC